MAKHKVAKEAKADAVVVMAGSGSRNLAVPKVLRSKKVWAAVIIVVIAVVVAVVVWPHPKPAKTYPAGFNSTDYSTMTDYELGVIAKDRTGMSVAELKQQTPKTIKLKSFDAAFAAAQIYERVGLPENALQAYTIASGKAKKDDYQFHAQFASFAINIGKDSVGRSEIAKARTAVGESKLSASAKQAELESLKTTESYIDGVPSEN